MNQQTAAKAAKWWADQLRGPARLKSGDRIIDAFITLSSFGQARPSAASIEVFEAQLRAAFEVLSTTEGVIASVDYEPCSVLAEAARAAGIVLNRATFPVKTRMFLTGSGLLEVTCGYHAPSSTL